MQSVLIVDDSATARLALRHAIEQDPELYVIGEADSGKEALAMARRLRPSVVTMDVILRRENGIEIAASIMAESPCPIVVVTACDTSDRQLVYQALQVGALEVVSKLPGPTTPEYSERVLALTRTLRNMAKVPVVTRRKRELPSSGTSDPATPVAVVTPTPGAGVTATPVAAATATNTKPTRGTQKPSVAPRLVVVGASTGGPPLLRDFLASLAGKPTVPIAIAQHISKGFGRGFAEWLKDTTGQSTVYVDRSMELVPGQIYIAPDDADLMLEGRLLGAPRPSKSVGGVPSVDVLFASAAACLGPAVVSLLMTGMGRDGAAGISELARVGASILVQDPKTCAVGSMPEAALRAAPDSTVLTPVQFPKVVQRLIQGEAPD